MNSREILIEGARQLDTEISRKQADLFINYLKNLQRWNKKISLTSLTGEKDIIIRHFLDSITIGRFVHDGRKLLDIGSGAGFPGIPLKIIMPSVEVTLIDSGHKKVYFLSDTIRRLRLKSISAVCGRAESSGNGLEGHYFDYVVTRAVGNIEKLIQLSIPYLADEGRIILMRGKKGLDEWTNAKNKIHNTLKLLEFKKIVLPFGFQQRVILAIGN